jgi:hypothetical protein
MTLIVCTLRRDPSTGALLDDPEPHPRPGQELGGFESWRTEVWGSDALRGRGAVFLPTLADSDLYVEANDLAQFQAECSALLADVDNLASELNVSVETLAHRLKNFMNAAARADPTHGCVYIG